MINFHSHEVEHAYQAHFARSRLKFDVLASLFSSVASLSFYIKATLDTPPADHATSLLFLVLVTTKALPLIAMVYMGQSAYLAHRSPVICAVSVCRYAEFEAPRTQPHLHSILAYVLLITSIDTTRWPCELVKSLTGEALGGSLVVALSYQLPFAWHLPVHATACAAAATALCTRLCGRALPDSPLWCPELQDAVAEAARVINHVVNMFVLPFAEWNDSTVRRPCVAATIMVIFNLGFVLPSCVLYFLEKTSRHAFAAARGLPALPSGALGLWLIDPLPLIGTLVYANCSLWLYVRLFEG